MAVLRGGVTGGRVTGGIVVDRGGGAGGFVGVLGRGVAGTSDRLKSDVTS
jgi:hypothetical protein